MGLKALIEGREGKRKELAELVRKAEEERRALSTEEKAKFDAVEAEIKELDETIKRVKAARDIPENRADEPETKKGAEAGAEKTEEMEVRAFIAWLRGDENTLNELRAEVGGLSYADNKGIVPVTIANKVIAKVKEISTIYNRVEHFNTNGTLEIPVYKADTKAGGNGEVRVAYQGAEFAELTAAQGKFETVELKGYTQGSLCIISNKLLNNTDIDVEGYLVGEMAKAFAEFWERELITGEGETEKHMTGAMHTGNLVYAGAKYTAADAANLDKFIDLQLAIPQQYQNGAVWIMNKDVFKEVRKLKDKNGNYYMAYGVGVAGDMGWHLLGKPVEISESMQDAKTAGNIPVLYGDFSGMAMKLTRTLNIQILREKYSDRNAVGIIGWAEVDSKIQNEQKIAALKMGDAPVSTDAQA
ncbi:MAG: phage major capsid protein [Lachnospiraceae bacterium]|nr:phage major capsid protein [Lachnospiraceae bacterium]